jgi:hypothetical protein
MTQYQYNLPAHSEVYNAFEQNMVMSIVVLLPAALIAVPILLTFILREVKRWKA